MTKYNNCYLVCHEHIDAVKDFLNEFFEEIETKYSHQNWITFKIPKKEFHISLMRGPDQPLTQNMVFEVSCSSIKELESFANEHDQETKSFTITETGEPYIYYYIQISGPKNICKIEINFIEKK